MQFFLKNEHTGLWSIRLTCSEVDIKFFLNVFSIFIKILSLLNIWKFKKQTDKAVKQIKDKSQKILYFFRLPRSFTDTFFLTLVSWEVKHHLELILQKGLENPHLALHFRRSQNVRLIMGRKPQVEEEEEA